MSNPYEAPKAPVDEPPMLITGWRPSTVTIALSILGFILFRWAVGAIRQFRTVESWEDLNNAWSLGYSIYLVAMTLIPAWLLVMIALARHWARVAAAILQTLDVMWRLYLFFDVEQAPRSELAGFFFTPAAQLVAFLLLFSSSANDWFRVNRSGALAQ